MCVKMYDVFGIFVDVVYGIMDDEVGFVDWIVVVGKDNVFDIYFDER